MSDTLNKIERSGWYPDWMQAIEESNGHAGNSAVVDGSELVSSNQNKEAVLLKNPDFFLSEILQGVESDTEQGNVARAQIYDSGKLVRNPWGGLRVDELFNIEWGIGQDIIVLHRDDNGEESIYEYGTVVSEPYFADDDLWWIDVERGDYEGKSHRSPRCLGIWGVTMNDNREWNPYFYVVLAPFESAQDSPNLNG